MNNADNITFKNMPTEFSLIDDLLRIRGLSFEGVGLYFLLWAISDKSVVLYSLSDIADFGNCGTKKAKRIINELIEKKLIIKHCITRQIYFFKILMPDENYENAKKEF